MELAYGVGSWKPTCGLSEKGFPALCESLDGKGGRLAIVRLLAEGDGERGGRQIRPKQKM